MFIGFYQFFPLNIMYYKWSKEKLAVKSWNGITFIGFDQLFQLFLLKDYLNITILILYNLIIITFIRFDQFFPIKICITYKNLNEAKKLKTGIIWNDIIFNLIK